MKRTSIGGADLDAETLQTDVMRFMAILSFCLMAILALVRNVDSLPVPAITKGSDPSVTPENGSTKPPSLAHRPAVDSTPPRRAQTRSTAGSSARRSPPAMEPLARAEPPPAMPPPPRPSPPVTPKSAPVSATEAESLILRFASDMDFLKLVSSAVVEVYAYDAVAAFKLTAGLTFAPAERPPQVRELLEDTIPALVREALVRKTRTDDSLTWGVRLPPDIESSIERHLAQQRTGVLLIDRHGAVRHVSSKSSS
jgi:hypothetical protein